jgi:transcriptional regulator with XRE-family HTH domain
VEEEIKDTILDNESIGNRIRQGREALELTRDQLAELLGISSYYLGQLERGERQMSLPVLVKISEKLHVSLDYLVLGKDSHESHDTTEIEALLKKCSKKELELVIKLIKTVLPYTN